MISAGSVGPSAPRLPCRYRRQRIPTFPSPTHKDRGNAPSDRSFLDARGQADLDPIIVTEGDAHSSSKREPQPPRYTICLRFASDVAASRARLASGWRAAPLPGGSRTLWIRVHALGIK